MMLLKASALCLLIAVTSAAVLSTSKLDSRCPTVNGQYPVFLPHETKCNLYYECDSGQAFLMPCPHHLLFNTKINVCDEPEKVNCASKAPEVPQVQAAPPSVLSSPGKRDVRCPKVDGRIPVFLPHETKCNQYYVCDSGLAILMPCPHHLLFNTDKNVCDEPERVSCGQKAPAAAPVGVEAPKVQAAPPSVLSSPGKRDVRCPKVDGRTPVFLAHETKCNQYYVCDSGLAILMPCPHHLLFNTDKNVCDEPERVSCGQKAPAAAPAVVEAPKVQAAPPAVLSSPGKRDVRCPKVDGRIPVFLPHETKCNQYYVCDSGLAILMPCPHHLLFNTDKNVCDEPERVSCGQKAPAAAPAVVEAPKVIAAAPSILFSPGKRDVRCPKVNGAMPVFLPHETKCNQYYVCDSGLAIMMPCPHHLLFNTDKNICDEPFHVTCVQKAPAETPAPSV